MLTPEHPDKGDPLFREKMEQFKKDRADKKARPDSWGVLRTLVHAKSEPEDGGLPNSRRGE